LTSPEESPSVEQSLESAKQEFGDVWTEENHKLHKPVPKVLYHYTRMNAFQDMMSSGVLWATDVRYMNDASEFAYGLKLVEEVISELRKEDEGLARLLRSIESRLSYLRLFVFSLSEKSNDLSQWTAYGGRLGGLAIGFETSVLVIDRSSDPKMKDILLINVEYDKDQQRSSVRTLLHKALSIYQKIGEDQVSRGVITGFIAERLFYHLIRLKHPCFSHEAEWRLVVTSLGPFDENIEYHSNAMGLVPHVLFKMVARAGPLTGKMPIRTIVQGPTVDKDLAKEALLGFLRRKGYQMTEVLVSDIPIRF
jgi:hypothetical protein